MLIADTFARPAGLPGRRERAREPALGRPRLQHLRRRRGQHRLEDRGRRARLGAGRAAGQLRAPSAAAWSSRRWPARQSNMRQPGRRPAPRRGRHPARQAPRVLQPRPGARLLLRRLAGHPAVGAGPPPTWRTPTSYTPDGRARARGCRTAGCRTARRCTTTSAAGSPCSGPPAGRRRRGPSPRRARPRARHPADRAPRRPPVTRGGTSSCWSGPTSTSPGGPPIRPASTWTSSPAAGPRAYEGTRGSTTPEAQFRHKIAVTNVRVFDGAAARAWPAVVDRRRPTIGTDPTGAAEVIDGERRRAAARA